MASTKFLKSKLNDRILRYDGVSEIEVNQIARFLLLGVPPSKIRVNAHPDELASFNMQVPVEDYIDTVYDEPVFLQMDWQIPEPYYSLDLAEYIAKTFSQRVNLLQYTIAEQEQAVLRIEAELVEIKTRGMTEFFRTVIYILAKLRNNTGVWGVGRGSSCASYFLFLIGLHVVDCVKLQVPMEEFFH